MNCQIRFVIKGFFATATPPDPNVVMLVADMHNMFLPCRHRYIALNASLGMERSPPVHVLPLVTFIPGKINMYLKHPLRIRAS